MISVLFDVIKILGLLIIISRSDCDKDVHLGRITVFGERIRALISTQWRCPMPLSSAVAVSPSSDSQLD